MLLPSLIILHNPMPFDIPPQIPIYLRVFTKSRKELIETTKRSRNLNVSFRVSEQERDLIEKKMELAGIRSLRAYLLKMAVDGYVVQLDLSEVRHMVTLLRTATNNMNQIARRTHETGNLYDADIRDLQEHYDKLWEQAGGILKKLSEL